MDVDEAHEWLAAGPWLLDGGLSTDLDGAGYDLSGHLWTAKILLEKPQAMEWVHRNFVKAGADVIATGSYQVSRQGFVAGGMSMADADACLRTSVEIARSAASDEELAGGRQVRVAGSLGSFGAILGNGQEYRGRFPLSVDQLATFHAERIAVIREAGPDLLAFETIPDVIEAVAIVQALEAAPEIPSWISFTCNSPMTTCADQSIVDAIRVAASCSSVVAVGVNCTAPEFVEPLLNEMAAESGIPLVAYPNHGMIWDGDEEAWSGENVVESATRAIREQAIQGWVSAGAQLVGGCCGIGSDLIAAAAPIVSRLRTS